MDHDEILKRISDLSAEQLFEYIHQGIVTLDELRTTNELDATKRKAIKNLQIQLDSKDDEAWERARYGNEASLRDYIANYPTGKYVQEAKNKIDEIIRDRENAQRVKQSLLENLKKNPNSCTPGMIQRYLQNDTITEYDLISCGIPQSIINRLNNVVTPRLQLGETASSIPDGYTEVYFWGIPGSGKTCALAATLSIAEKLGYLDIATGPGYDYMTRLKNIFIKENAILPPPSPVEATQYLPFVLKKGNDKPRSISLIELSGEIFQCFFRKNANLSLQSQQHEDTFNSLIRFLKGRNRKIHFFFIDFEKENDTDIDGYTQGDYLSAASTFFKNNDVFDKSTDAIYIVITKSDLMPNVSTYQEKVEYAKRHLQTNNFSAFINTLKDRCKQHSINAGKLTVEPFSLGKVYFQQICDFDQTSATKIIDILIERIAPNKKSILDVFNR
jgi:hypothetical protein